MFIQKNIGFLDRKIFLQLILCWIMLLLCAISSQSLFIYLYIFVVTAIIIFQPVEESIILCFGLVNFTRLIILDPTTPRAAGFGWIFTVFLILKSLYTGVRISKDTFLLSLVFCIYMCFGLQPGETGFFSDIKTIINYFFLMILASRFDKQNWLKLFDFYVAGHLLANLLYYPVSGSPYFQLLLQEAYTDTSVINLFRFTGLDQDANYFAANCSFIIAIALFFLSNEDKFPVSKLKIRIVLLVYTLLGALSFSKTFFISIALLLFLYSVSNLLNNLLNVLKIILFLVISFCVIEFLTEGAFFDIIENVIFARFVDTNTDLNHFTTGRVNIWLNYIESWSSSFLNILFGLGMANKMLPQLGKVQHQTFLEILYQFGIIGTILFFTYINSLFKYIKSGNVNKNVSLKYVGFASVFIFSLALNQFTVDHLVYQLLMSSILLSGGCSATIECRG